MIVGHVVVVIVSVCLSFWDCILDLCCRSASICMYVIAVYLLLTTRYSRYYYYYY